MINDIYVLLVISLLVMLLVEYFLHKNDILYPSVLMTLTMFLSSFLSLLTANQWGYTISSKVYLLLITSILAFNFGCYFVSYYLETTSCLDLFRVSMLEYLNKPFKLNYSVCILSILILGLIFIYNLYDLYRMSLSLGNHSGILSSIKVVRRAIEAQDSSLDFRWMNYRQQIAAGIAYCYSYFFLKQIVLNGESLKKNLFLVFPSIIYVAITVLNTGRILLISFFIYNFFVFSVLYKQKYKFSLKVNNKITLYSIIFGVVCIFLFMIIGVFTGKGFASGNNIFFVLAHYLGLSIPALGVKLNNAIVTSNYVGSDFMVGVYRILHKVSSAYPEVDIFLPFTKFYNIDTNVYTAEWRYYSSFGFVGLLLMMWILGVFFSSFYWAAKYLCKPLVLITYGYCSYVLFLSSIDERFFIDLFGTTFIYQVLIFTACFHVLQRFNR